MVITSFQKVFFVPYTVLNYFKIEHPETCERMHNFLKRQMSNSTQLSTAGERDRSLFFNKMHEKVDLVKDYLNLDSKMAIL